MNHLGLAKVAFSPNIAAYSFQRLTAEPNTVEDSRISRRGQ